MKLEKFKNNIYDISLSETKFIDEINETEIAGDISKQKHGNLNEEQLIVLKHLLVS